MFKGRLCLFVAKFTYDNKRIIMQMGHLKIECNICLLVEILILTNPQQSYYFLSAGKCKHELEYKYHLAKMLYIFYDTYLFNCH